MELSSNLQDLKMYHRLKRLKKMFFKANKMRITATDNCGKMRVDYIHNH